MHPVLYNELKQVLRAYKSILFIISIMLLSRATLGDYGHLLNLFAVFPIIAGALGTGLLFEEYSKDYMKYLYTLPIKRWHFIFIKMVIAVIAAAIFLLIIYIIRWLIPPRMIMPAFIFPIFFNLNSLFLFTAAIALFNYGMCTFTITFLKSAKMAGNLNFLSLTIAVMYLLYRFLDTGYKFKTLDYMLIFIPSSLILLLGGFYLFTLRNPFLNRNPRHFLTGISILAISIGYFAGSTQLIIQREENGIFEVDKLKYNFKLDRGVKYYSVSPDGEFVYVEMSPDNLFVHSYILDASGKLIADLGKYSSVFNYNLLWQFNNGKRMIVYRKEKPLLSEISSRKFIDYFVLDIDNQEEYTFNIITEDYRWGEKYKRLNCHTLEFTGICYTNISDRDSGLSVFKQNILTGSIAKFPIPNSQEVSPYDVKHIDSKYIVFDKSFYKDKMSGNAQTQIVIFDVKEREIDEILLPEGVSYDDYTINIDKCYFIETLSDEYGYSFRVIGRTLEGEDEIYLAPEELFGLSYKKAAKEGFYDDGPSFSVSPQKKWLQCYYKNPEGRRQLMLLDMEEEENRVDININLEEIGNLVFSPGEMRFYAFHRYIEEEDSERNTIYIYDIVEQKAVFFKKYEFENNIESISFLDDETMIYIKDPTPDEEWVNNRYLVRLNLETMERTAFSDNHKNRE